MLRRSLLFFSVFLTLATSPMVRAETAQPLTDEYIESIRLGCSDALQGLLQIERSEAATRVNRGREYESLLRLMGAFNSRVVFNKIDAPVLTSTAAKMQTKVVVFQKRYLLYADKIDATLDINCKEAPVTFYDRLTEARQERVGLANDIKEIDALLDEYQKGIDALRADLAKAEVSVQQ